MIKLWFEMLADIFRTPPREQWHMLKRDSVYALRLMSRNPGFTLITLLTLALGVGANTSIFSLVHGIMLRPLIYTRPDEISIVQQKFQKSTSTNLNFSVPEYLDYRSQSQSMSAMVEYHTMTFTLLGNGQADRVRTGVVSWDFFDFFGVKPVMGRSFAAAEEQPGAPAVILLSYEYWLRKFHGDPAVIGRNFAMNDKIHTVIGVLPSFPQYPHENDVYMTTSACPFRSNPVLIQNRNSRLMSVFARRKPQVTLSQASDDLSLIAGRLQKQYPASYRPALGYTALALSLKDVLTRRARSTLLVLLCAAGFVLLIACANVANFTLARMSQREQEITLRAALGAARGRLLRQLFTESLLLGFFAAGLGLVVAIVSHKLLVQFVSRLTPRAGEIAIDGSVLLFALAAAVITSIITGSSIAFSSRAQMSAGLNESSRGFTLGSRPRRIQNVLIVAQVAFALILLVGAGLMLRSFFKLQKVDLGFNPERVLTMAIDLNWTRYNLPATHLLASRAILNKVQSLPGVLSASVSSSFPLDPDAIAAGANTFNATFQIEGKPIQEGEAPPVGTVRSVSPAYFKTLGIPLIQGRLLEATDTPDAPRVLVISQALAQHRFPGEDPIGRRVSGDRGATWLSIVGVVGNTKEFGVSEDPVDEIYEPIEQTPRLRRLVVRTIGDPASMANSLRGVIHDFDPETAIANVETLEEARSDSLSSSRVMTNLLGIFAALALVIAASGIGGMLALSVSQRVREIGVRLALGAQPMDVLAMIIRQGMVLVAIGLAFGLAFALALTGPLKTFLFKVAPTDPLALISVCLLLALTALVACYIPARRATRIDPLAALRHE